MARYLLIEIDTDDEDFEDYQLDSLIEAIDQAECGWVKDANYKPHFPAFAGGGFAPSAD